MLLPICFLWVFIGCVSLCTEHSNQRSTCESLSSDEYRVCNEEYCCPFTSLLPSILPDRRLASFAVGNREVTVLLAELSRQVSDHQLQVLIPVQTADPPLKRLPTLRI